MKKLKKEKKLEKEMLKEFVCKESLIAKEKMFDFVSIQKSSTIKTQTMEKGTITNPRKNLSTNISSEVLKDEVSKIKLQDTRKPYRH